LCHKTLRSLWYSEIGFVPHKRALSFLRKQESRNMKKKIHNRLIYIKVYADSPGFLLSQE